MDLDLEIADYKTILVHKGAIQGDSGECKFADLYNVLKNTCENSLKNAKGILINFDYPKNITLPQLEKVMEKLDKLCNDEADIIYNTNEDESLENSTISYQIICSGL
jgi:cell division GTPase FtsZ